MVFIATSSRASCRSSAPLARRTFVARIEFMVESPLKTVIDADMPYELLKVEVVV